MKYLRRDDTARNDRTTALMSISARPSPANTFNAPHWLDVNVLPLHLVT